MSDTLVDYARPLIDRLPDDHTLEELKAVIEFAAFLSNAVAVEDIPQFVVHLSTKMPPRLRVPAPKALAVVRRMLTRKDLSFGDDHRLVVVVGPGSQGAAASNNLVAQQATCQVLRLDVGAVNLKSSGSRSRPFRSPSTSLATQPLPSAIWSARSWTRSTTWSVSSTCSTNSSVC